MRTITDSDIASAEILGPTSPPPEGTIHTGLLDGEETIYFTDPDSDADGRIVSIWLPPRSV